MVFVVIQTLVTQLKDSIPGMEAAVVALRDQVNSSDMVRACLDAQSALSSPLPHEARQLKKVQFPSNFCTLVRHEHANHISFISAVV